MIPLVWSACWVLTAGAALPPPTCVDARALRGDLREAREELSELRGLSSAHPDYMTRREMVRKVDEVRRLLDKLEATLDDSSGDDALPPAPPVPPPQPAMAPDRFEALLKAMEGSNFDESKLQVVQDAAGTNHFTVEQVRQIVEQLSFAAGRIQAAVALHPRLVDPQNFFQVYELLPFEADRKKLREAVK